MAIEHQSPAVSVVLPVFNGETTIRRAINSCLAQTMPDFELLVVDDCSIDGTREEVRSIRDSRINLLFNRRNLGPGPSRDRGLRQSRGRWLTFLDADDLYKPSRLEILLRRAEEVGIGCVLMDRWTLAAVDGRPLGLRDTTRIQAKAEWLSPGEVVRRQISGWPFFSSGLLESSGAVHPATTFGEDTAFLIQLMNVSGARLVRLPDSLYLYTAREDSLRSAPKRLNELESSYRYLLEECALAPELALAVEALRGELEGRRRLEALIESIRSGQYLLAIRSIGAYPALIPELGRAIRRHFRFRRATLRHQTTLIPDSGSNGS